MKTRYLLPLLVACLMTACGPSESELRAELSRINAQMMSLNIAAQQHRAQMSQAEFDAFIGSFAAGYGAVSGDYELAGDGATTAYQSSQQYDASSYSLDQLKQRFDTLAERRLEIIKDLN